MDVDAMTTEKRERCMKQGLCFRCERRGHLGKDCPTDDDKKRDAPKSEPKKMSSKEAHTHIKALVALMDKDEVDALFKQAEDEGF